MWTKTNSNKPTQKQTYLLYTCACNNTYALEVNAPNKLKKCHIQLPTGNKCKKPMPNQEIRNILAIQQLHSYL